MWLTRLAISRRVTIAMFIMGLVIMGLVGLTRMPWDLIPKIDIPVVSVTVPYPGAGPQEVEQRVLKPVENAVSVINGVDTVSSTAYENMGNVTIQFKYGTDIDAAAADVRDAIDRAKASFPDDVTQPSLYKIDISAMPIFVVGISGNRAPRDLRKLVDDEIKPRLGQVTGVASVSVSGGEEREIQVLVHRERLDAVGLSIAKLAEILRGENIDIPSGNVKEGRRDYAVRVLGQFSTIDQMRRLRISTPLGGIVPLSSLAEVQDTVVESDTLARIDGKPTVMVSIVKQSDANTVGVVRGARKTFEELLGSIEETSAGEGKGGEAAGAKKGELPSDIKAVVAQDSSERVLESIKDVRDALLYGALLAALVVFLFLHNFRGTLIVAIAIPTSIVATFLPVGLGFGFTLNMMVMLALSLAVGVLVDDSIVVLENIERHLRRGEQPKEAAYNGRTEVGGAAVAITFVDVVVFIPIAMMGGIIGRFFYPFGITAFVCTLFSLLMSFTLTPMLASWWYTRRERREESGGGIWQAFFRAWDRGYGRLEHVYRPVLRRVVAHPYITLFIGYGILIATVMLIMPRLGFEFFPASDEGQVQASLEMPVGTRLEETDKVVRRIESLLNDRSKYPEVKHVAGMVGVQSVGVTGASGSGGQYGIVRAFLSRRRVRVEAGQRSDQEVVAALRQDILSIPDVIAKVTAESSMGGGGGADVELNVLCENQELLGRASVQLAQKIRQIPGLLYVDLSSKPGRPEIHVQIDRDRASDLGLSVDTIGKAVRTALSGNTDAKYREGGEEYDLRVQYAKADRSRVDEVGDIFVGLTTSGQRVRLRDVARVFLSTGPSRIERYNRQRMTTVSATLDPTVILLGTAQEEINKILDANPIPGVATTWAGNVKRQGESFGYLFQALFLAITLVYLVTAALYNSLLQPLNVMLTIPMALVGGVFGLWVTGNALSMIAMIGVIQLVGLVGKNAILMVDFTNTLRGRGLSRTEALLQAGPTRMKPILMTTLAAIGGALPTALAVNEGSEWRAPMAVVVIFGLAVSTMLSLLVVPATYCIFDQVGVFFGRMGRGFMGLAGILGKRKGGDDDELPPVGPPSEPLPPLKPLPEAEAPPTEQPPTMSPSPPVLMPPAEPKAEEGPTENSGGEQLG